MASPDQVKQYLAYWFQLGKRLNLEQDRSVLPPVFTENHYSPAFEACWQQVLQVGGRDCYLDGTTQSLEELFSPRWDISDCARCSMPVPILNLGVWTTACPCFDLPTWPNTDLPQPRSAIDNHTQLSKIRERLSRQHLS